MRLPCLYSIKEGSDLGHVNEQCSYDDNGNLKSIAVPGDLASGRNLAFTWDPGDRLVQADTTAFAYDPSGYRIRKTFNAYQRNAAGTLVNSTFHHDPLQSVLGQSGHGGSVLAAQSYTAFGKAKQALYSNNELKYTGRERDGATGFYYYRARYYDPVIGRFISEDPKGFGAGVNFYAYCLDNPDQL